MIPKIIHYCWFGGNDKSELVERCISSWKKYCPDYKIIEWNENNYNVNKNKYTKYAYERQKWAFVSDYVRLYVIYKYGGIYMDTDVEVVKNLDKFLKYESFSGFESTKYIPTGIMGGEKNSRWIKYLLSYYDNKSFINEDGTLDNFGFTYVTGDGIERDENGNVIDKIEPSASTIYELINDPELTHKGEALAWFGAAFICVLNVLSILFADELFRWNLLFQIRNVENAEPSDWEIAGRYIGWTVMTIMSLVIFITGLQ